MADLSSDGMFRDVSADTAGIMPVSQQRLPMRVAAVSHEETTPGMVCLGTYLHDRLIGMLEITPEAFDQFMKVEWAHTPVRLALPTVAMVDNSMRAVLCLLVPIAAMRHAARGLFNETAAGEGPDDRDSALDDEEEEETAFGDDVLSIKTRAAAIAESAGSTQFEQRISQRSGRGWDADEEALAISQPSRFLLDGDEFFLLPVGSIMRLPANRQHPRNARDEAHAMLRSLMQGRAMRLVDMILQNEGL